MQLIGGGATFASADGARRTSRWPRSCYRPTRARSTPHRQGARRCSRCCASARRGRPRPLRRPAADAGPGHDADPRPRGAHHRRALARPRPDRRAGGPRGRATAPGDGHDDDHRRAVPQRRARRSPTGRSSWRRARSASRARPPSWPNATTSREPCSSATARRRADVVLADLGPAAGRLRGVITGLDRAARRRRRPHLPVDPGHQLRDRRDGRSPPPCSPARHRLRRALLARRWSPSLVVGAALRRRSSSWPSCAGCSTPPRVILLVATIGVAGAPRPDRRRRCPTHGRLRRRYPVPRHARGRLARRAGHRRELVDRRDRAAGRAGARWFLNRTKHGTAVLGLGRQPRAWLACRASAPSGCRPSSGRSPGLLATRLDRAGLGRSRDRCTGARRRSGRPRSCGPSPPPHRRHACRSAERSSPAWHRDRRGARPLQLPDQPACSTSCSSSSSSSPWCGPADRAADDEDRFSLRPRVGPTPDPCDCEAWWVRHPGPSLVAVWRARRRWSSRSCSPRRRASSSTRTHRLLSRSAPPRSRCSPAGPASCRSGRWPSPASARSLAAALARGMRLDLTIGASTRRAFALPPLHVRLRGRARRVGRAALAAVDRARARSGSGACCSAVSTFAFAVAAGAVPLPPTVLSDGDAASVPLRPRGRSSASTSTSQRTYYFVVPRRPRRGAGDARPAAPQRHRPDDDRRARQPSGGGGSRSRRSA